MKMYKRIVLLLFFSCVLFSAGAQSIFGFEGEDASLVGVYIKDLNTGEVLYDYNSELAMTPASVMKSVTTATALELTGADFSFKTAVCLKGKETTKGFWHADLVVKSSGDPTLESVNFENNRGFCDSICSSLLRKGVKKIEGNIVVEQSLSDSGPVVQWEIEDVAWPYGAGLFGFNFMDNICKVYPVSGKTAPFVPGLNVKFINSPEATDLIRGVGSNNLTVTGRRSELEKRPIETTVPDPATVMSHRLKEMLSAKGISVGDKPVATAADGETTVYIHKSPSAAEIMKSLMVRSDNLFAEGMLRTFAPGGSRTDAIKRLKSLWNVRGLDAKYSLILDGSGLARANRLQPRFVAEVLEWMAKSDKAELYASFFPRAGIDGTLQTFLSDSPLKGRLALKTGSMRSVQCYAGYRFSDDDSTKPTHVVVIMINGFFCRRAEIKKCVEDFLSDTFH